MNENELFSKYFDHTILKPYINDNDLITVANECIENDFKMIAINSCQVKRAKELLGKTNINIGAAVGFPLGQQTIRVKVFETLDAIENGCDEIDYVINITELKNRNYEYIKEEMMQIVKTCRQHSVISKVIIEICYLTDDEIVKCCEIANDIKPDFVKTSTGFGEYGATVEAVKLMKRTLLPSISIKAAGGIRDLDTVLNYIKLGVSRIGTSNSVEILKEYSLKND